MDIYIVRMWSHTQNHSVATHEHCILINSKSKMPFTLLIGMVYFSRSNHLKRLELDCYKVSLFFYSLSKESMFCQKSRKKRSFEFIGLCVIWETWFLVWFSRDFEWCALHSNCKNSNVPYLILILVFAQREREKKKNASVSIFFRICGA